MTRLSSTQGRLRATLTLAAGASALFGCAQTTAEPEEPAFAPGNQELGLISARNTADLPNRCPPEDQDWQIVTVCPLEMTCDPTAFDSVDAFWIDIILFGDMRRQPYFVKFQSEVDYYNRREPFLAKLEARIETLPAEKKPLAYENYSSALVYLGEFQRAVDVFGTGGTLEAATSTDPYITFDVAHALFRLGRYEDSWPYASRAHRWTPAFDTKWQLMLTEVHLYGKDFWTKWSKDQYVTNHILESFPEKDARHLPFRDATKKMGIDDADRFGGYGAVSWADFDNDGWDDLMFEKKLFPFKVYRNVEGKRLEYIGDDAMGGKACSHVFSVPADVDNDGLMDLTRNCCNYDSKGDLIQLKNITQEAGKIAFKDVTAATGLVRDKEAYPASGLGMNVNYCDLDLDGDLDALAADFGGPAGIYQNQGDGTFKEVHEQVGINTPGDAVDFGGLGLSCGDLDGDGWPEVFAQGWGWRRLYKNLKNGKFADITPHAGIDGGKEVKGYVNFTFDYNNDGLIDLFAGAYVTSDQTQLGVEKICGCHKLLTEEGYTTQQWSQASTIYRNDGDMKFTNIGESTKFVPFGSMGANYGDYNNDEWKDIVLASGGPYTQQAEPFQFYENVRGTGRFLSRTPWNELGLWGKGHGNAFADYDHDGDLDVMLQSGGFQPGDQWPSSLLENIFVGNHFLEITLKASRPGTNRSAIGARVDIYYGDGRHQTEELWDAKGFASTNTHRLHFGLATYDKVDKITVRWPNRDLLTQELKDVAVDQAIEIDEATGSYKTLWTAPR